MYHFFILRLTFPTPSGLYIITLSISLNTTYTRKADFQKDTKRQDIAPWVTPFYYIVLALKWLLGDRSQILCDDSKLLLDTYQIPIDSQCHGENFGSCGKINRSIQNWHIPINNIV